MKNIAVYELVDGLILNMYQNKSGAYVVQARDAYDGKEFDTQAQAIEYVLARASEAESYNRDKS